MSNPVTTGVRVGYNNSRTGKYNILNDFVEDISITDSAVGEGDNVDITIEDDERKMLHDYYPGADDMIICTIYLSDPEAGRTGVIGNNSFHLDQFGYSDYPSKMTLRGVCIPKNSTFAKTPQTKTWQNITLESIIWKICSKYGLSLRFEPGSFNPTIVKSEQSNATDLSYIYSLCQTYGNGMKIYSDKLVVFAEETYEKKAAVRTIGHRDILDGSFSARFNLTRQYTGYKYEYDDSSGTHWIKGKGFAISPEIIISVGQCDNDRDGVLKGQAKVNEANRDLQIINFEIMGDPKMVSTATFNLSGFGGLDGKYYINKTVNKFSASGGFTQEIEARKIQQRL